MSDSDLVLRIPHALGVTEAKRRIASGLASLQAQYGGLFSKLEAEWADDLLTFRVTALAQTVRGTVVVKDDYAELRAELPIVIRMLTKRFMPALQEKSQKLLTKGP